MKLTPNLFRSISGLFSNEIPSASECEAYSDLLGSVQECLAWMLLRSPNAPQHASLLAELTALAMAQVATAQTRRTQTNFPQAEAKSYDKVSSALHSLLAEDRTNDALNASAYAALVEFANNRSDEYNSRHNLGIGI
ncbi:hypothetical protein PWR63_04480 [Paraburkholderia sp. A2WS-5]|uniref:hypothetical protein n=1 Tax=Paraburkholderia sp. A2WS-5 TaxID=3028372 RepID=UPI003B77ADA3